MNILDRSISWLSPSAGLRRMRARKALGIMEKFAYESAKTGRRTEGWNAGATSPNVEIGQSLPTLRARSRQIMRDTPYGQKAARVICSSMVGTGIVPRTNTGNEALDELVADFWERWQQESDADDQLNGYGLQKLIIRTVFESGECLVRFRPRLPQDNMETIPLQIQVLEPDYLDMNRNQMLQNGAYIMQGVEFDMLGTRQAYWMFGQHPGDILNVRQATLVSHRVPASEVLHIYDKQRPGQVRGVPWLTPVLLKMRDIDDMDEAYLVLKKIQSCFAGFVTQPEGIDGAALAPTSAQDGTGFRIEAFEPGMIEYLKPGEDIKFGAPTTDTGYADFMRTQLRAVATGIGLTYEQLTGDLSTVNYSSYRAGHLDFRAWIEDFRWNAFMPMCVNPIWNRFKQTSIIAGLIPDGTYPVKWTAPRFMSIDPWKDAKADETMMRNGTLTLAEAIAQQGFDPDEQLEEIAETNKKLDELGIVLDSDPRKGPGQNTGQGANPNGQQQAA